jgi:predicted metal-binding protein
MPLAQATLTAATIGNRIHFSSCMIAKKPAPNSIFGGCRFSEKIMLKQ